MNKKVIYTISSLIVIYSIWSIIEAIKSLDELFGGLGVTIISLFIILPILALIGAIYLGYKMCTKKQITIYSLFVGIVYMLDFYFIVDYTFMLKNKDALYFPRVQVFIISFGIVYLVADLISKIRNVIVKRRNKMN